MDLSAIPVVGPYIPLIALVLFCLYIGMQILFRFMPSARSAADRAGALSIIDTLARSSAGSLVYQMIDHDGDGRLDYKTGNAIVDQVAQQIVTLGADSLKDLGVKNPTASDSVVRSVAEKRVQAELLTAGIKMVAGDGPVKWGG